MVRNYTEVKNTAHARRCCAAALERRIAEYQEKIEADQKSRTYGNIQRRIADVRAMNKRIFQLMNGANPWPETAA